MDRHSEVECEYSTRSRAATGDRHLSRGNERDRLRGLTLESARRAYSCAGSLASSQPAGRCGLRLEPGHLRQVL